MTGTRKIIEKSVRLFKNGSNQALRIPKEFEFDCDQAVIQKDGDRLIIHPVRRSKLLTVLEGLKPLTDDFPDVDENIQPLDGIDL